jgi:hypothetical protein
VWSTAWKIGWTWEHVKWSCLISFEAHLILLCSKLVMNLLCFIVVLTCYVLVMYFKGQTIESFHVSNCYAWNVELICWVWLECQFFIVCNCHAWTLKFLNIYCSTSHCIS